jgi:hypothetical protein
MMLFVLPSKELAAEGACLIDRFKPPIMPIGHAGILTSIILG